MSRAEPTAEAERVTLDAPFLRVLGLESAEAVPDGLRLRLPHRADNANRNGTLHGGVIASLVETAGALALERPAVGGSAPAWRRPAAVDLSIHFVAPAIACDVEAEARIVRRGRSVGFAEVAVADADGSPIARGLLAARPVSTLSSPLGAGETEHDGAGLPASHREALERLSFSRFSGSAFSARLQVRSARIPGAGVVALLPWQELLADEFGQVHAGAIATLVDAAGGASAWTAGGFDPRGRASTIAMHLTVARAPAGADLVAIAEAPWRTGDLFSIAVEVATRDRAEPVARGSVVYRVVRPS